MTSYKEGERVVKTRLGRVKQHVNGSQLSKDSAPGFTISCVHEYMFPLSYLNNSRYPLNRHTWILLMCVCVVLRTHGFADAPNWAQAWRGRSRTLDVFFHYPLLYVSTEPEAHHFYLDWLASEFSESACLDPLMPTWHPTQKLTENKLINQM